MQAPTLVYEPRYPRTRNIRWAYVGRKLLEMGLCAVLQYATFKQFMLPVMQHPSRFALPVWIAPVASFSFDLMKLALPSLVIWLTGFYSIFHCWLNVLAELTRFADRCVGASKSWVAVCTRSAAPQIFDACVLDVDSARGCCTALRCSALRCTALRSFHRTRARCRYFYSSWWNATTLDAFWRKWNVPVHEVCVQPSPLHVRALTDTHMLIPPLAITPRRASLLALRPARAVVPAPRVRGLATLHEREQEHGGVCDLLHFCRVSRAHLFCKLQNVPPMVFLGHAAPNPPHRHEPSVGEQAPRQLFGLVVSFLWPTAA